MGFALGVLPFFFLPNSADDDIIVLGGRMASGADGVNVHAGDRRLMERSIERVIAALEAKSVGREIVAMENEVK